MAAAWGDGTPQALSLDGPGTAKEFAGGIAHLDPRLDVLGARFLLPRENIDALKRAGFAASDADADSYDHHRLALGVPDGTRDLAPEKALLMESNFDELNGIDWQKGCYMGQELTARMKYRALVKKRLLPVTIEGGDVAPGTAITQDGREAGEMLSARDGRGLALLRLEAVDAAQNNGADLKAGAARIKPERAGLDEELNQSSSLVLRRRAIGRRAGRLGHARIDRARHNRHHEGGRRLVRAERSRTAFLIGFSDLR